MGLRVDVATVIRVLKRQVLMVGFVDGLNVVTVSMGHRRLLCEEFCGEWIGQIGLR